jgi:Tfp pilus assembly protein PilO
MTHKEDLLRLYKTEATHLRQLYHKEVEKNTNLEEIIKSKDSIIEQLELQLRQQEVRMSYLEVGNNIVDEYIR